MKPIIPALSMLLTLFVACGDGPLGGGPSRTNKMSATINGRTWSAEWDDITAVRTSSTLSISGIGLLDSSEITLLLTDLDGMGTYPLDSGAKSSAEFVTASSIYRSRLLPAAGEIVLTRLDSERAAGTFRFTARAITHPTDTDAVVVVEDGIFDVALVR